MATAISATGAKSPPITQVGVLGWLRENLFSTWYNVVLSAIALYIIYFTVAALWDWGIANAVWVAKDRRECFDINPDGACWAGVIIWSKNIIWGRYAAEDLWRVNLGAAILVVWMAPIWFPRVKAKIFIGLSTVFFYPFLAAYLFLAARRACSCRSWSRWRSSVSSATPCMRRSASPRDARCPTCW